MKKTELLKEAALLGIVGRSRMNKGQLEAAIKDHDERQGSSITQLSEVLAAVRKGRDFAEGTVIRWVSAELYIYAAIKTSVGWFTTSRYGNPFVPQVLSFNDLLEILKKDDTSDVEVAVTWAVVS